MLDFFFLSEEQVIGNNMLSIFKKNYEIRIAPVTDYALLLGADFSFTKTFFNVTHEEYIVGEYWTTTHDSFENVITIDTIGDTCSTSHYHRYPGGRPAIRYSQIKNLITSKKVRDDGILEVEFGEYPQFVVEDDNLVIELERLWNNGNPLPELKYTDKAYSFDGTDYSDYDIGFSLEQYLEVEYKGNKYFRIVVGDNGQNVDLSNGCGFLNGDVCWLEVEPVKWYVDESEDIAVSEKILYAGIQYSYDKKNINFPDSDIKQYMDDFFCKEILPSDMIIKNVSDNKKEAPNPYNFDFSNVSEEEIIKGCVEANIAVMLHGKSGDGKSARVKELDPDAEILYLINASPESLCGKSIVLPSGEMKNIPPTWYTKLVEKCEKEPDKIHIVFFDEITNASGSIQGMAFNIVLDKEIDGKWKLPKNARIVAAGNELEDSMSSYGMSQPLFNRFAHVDIETKVEDWLMWASTPSETYERLDYKKKNVPMKIHPSVYAFIAYKGENALRTKYTGKEPNADPRKWELASKVLYETRKPEMIRSLVGKDLTMEFVSFCQQRVITIEDVLSGNYTEADLDMNTGEKYNTAVGLSSVSMDHFEIVREFVKRLGPEICATFETLWAHGIEERLEKIQEIKLSERTK